MNVIVQVLQTLVFLFVLFLLGRVVLSWVTMLARDWRPSGASLFVVEAIYTVTDPPVRFVRRIIPPLTIGQIRFDVAIIVLFFASYFVNIALALIQV